jgi:hypothetical protein
MQGLSYYLNKYYKMQDKIVLVNRKNPNDNWSDRCLFLDEHYSAHKPYNHRSILNNEIVIEFDYDDPEFNASMIRRVVERLNKDNITYAKWKSGNKSTHLHMFIEVGDCGNIPLLKNVVMRYYGTFYKTKDGKIHEEKPEEEYIKILPDLRLSAQNHLIRAENGLHETSGNKKTLLTTCGKFPEINPLKKEIWERYSLQQKINASRALMSHQNNDELKKKMKIILDSTEFRNYNDGRERALFILIHYLKESYKDKKQDLITYLADWYRYSGGHKMSKQDIERKVSYQWHRSYRIDNMVDELLESIQRN